MSYYEVHVTVAFKGPKQLSDFCVYCRERMMAKANLIQLSCGKYPMQLMLAKKAELNDDAEALEWGGLTGMIMSADWNIQRVKVEAPLSDGPSVYFEAHWKLLSNTGVYPYKMEELVHFAPNFLVSRNVLDTRVHYLSMRSYQPDFFVAHQAFDTGHGYIKKSNLSLENLHYERVICDTNPFIDEGWEVGTILNLS